MNQLELFTDANTPAAAPPRPLEAWEIEKDVPGWLRVAARTLHRWPAGRVLTESEFDAGVRAASDLTFR